MTIVAVTGANGYVGAHLVRHLAAAGGVRALARAPSPPTGIPGPVDYRRIGDLAEGAAALGTHLEGVDAVFHLVSPATDLPAQAQRRVHVEGTRSVLAAARAAGVGWFCFLSSVKAMAGEAAPGSIAADAMPRPDSAYGRCKLAAERLVLAEAGNMATTVVRCPMVYGPGASGNFARLCAWLGAGRPVPRFAENHPRSIVYVGNIAAALVFLRGRGHAAPRIVHVADEPPVPVNELFELIADALAVAPPRVYIPALLTKLARAVPGVRGYAQRLTGRLVLDTSTMTALGWRPPVGTREAIRHSVPPPTVD